MSDGLGKAAREVQGALIAFIAIEVAGFCLMVVSFVFVFAIMLVFLHVQFLYKLISSIFKKDCTSAFALAYYKAGWKKIIFDIPNYYPAWRKGFNGSINAQSENHVTLPSGVSEIQYIDALGDQFNHEMGFIDYYKKPSSKKRGGEKRIGNNSKPGFELAPINMSDQYKTRKKHGRVRCPYCGSTSTVVSRFDEELEYRKCKNGHSFVYSYLFQAVNDGEENYRTK